MTVLDSFFLMFDSDTSKLNKGLDESDKKTTSLIDKLRGVDTASGAAGGGLQTMLGKLAGVLGLGLSFAAIVQGVRHTAEAYDQLYKLEARFRSTSEAIDEFKDASGLLGISSEGSTEMLGSLDRAIQDVFLGMGKSKKVFEELGIEVTDSNGKIKGTVEVMKELAGVFKGMEKGTQIRVLERLGLDPSLLKYFNADLGALQKRLAAIDAASGFSLDKAVKRSAEYTKATKELKLEVNTLTTYLEKLKERFDTDLLPYFTDGIKVATKYLKMLVEYLLGHSHFVEGALIAIGGAISYFLVPAAIKGAIAAWAMISPFLLIGAVVAAAGIAFALLYDDITNFIEGNDSLIGQLSEKWGAFRELVKAVGVDFIFIWDILKAFGTFLVALWEYPRAAVGEFKDNVLAAFGKIGDAYPALKKIADQISEAFTLAGNTIGAVWEWVTTLISKGVEALMGALRPVGDMLYKIKGALGYGDSTVQYGNISDGMIRNNLSRANIMLREASGTALASQTSGSISNSSVGGNRTVNVNVGDLNVNTAATDTAGITRDLSSEFRTQMRQAVSNYDDGVAG